MSAEEAVDLIAARIDKCLKVRKELFGTTAIRGIHMRMDISQSRTADWINRCTFIQLFPSVPAFPLLCQTRESKTVFVAKVVPYEHGSSIKTPTRPENVDSAMHVMLASSLVLKRKLPNIVLPYGSVIMDTEDVLSAIWTRLVKAESKRTWKEWRKEINVLPKSRVLFMEYCSGGDLASCLSYLHKEAAGGLIPTEYWISILGQICLTLARLQKDYPGVRDNDAHVHNWLIEFVPESTTYVYKMGKTTYVLPTQGIELRLFDFEYATVPGLIDNDVFNSKRMRQHSIDSTPNTYVDLHTVLNNILNIMPGSSFPKAVRKFLDDAVPEQYRYSDDVSERLGRLKPTDKPVTTPANMLKHSLFQKIRGAPKTSKSFGS